MKWWTRWASMCAVAAAMGVGLTACKPSPVQFKGIDVTGANYAQTFTLTDQWGQTRSLSDFKGKAVVLFFGYTQCPDVCPTSLNELAEAKRLLGTDADRLQGVFVTVDPGRDTADLLKNYMANFDASFVAFVPTPEQLAVVAKEFKIYYKKVDGPTPTSYTMDHTAGSYIYDPQGRLRVYSRYGAGAQALADDVKILLSGR